MPKVNIKEDVFGLYVKVKSGDYHIARPLPNHQTNFKVGDLVDVFWQHGKFKHYPMMGVGKQRHHKKGQYDEYWPRTINFQHVADPESPIINMIKNGMFMTADRQNGAFLPKEFIKNISVRKDINYFSIFEELTTGFHINGHFVKHDDTGEPAVKRADGAIWFFCNGYTFSHTRSYVAACGASDELLFYLLLKYGENLPSTL